ncbi:MAG TPA: glycosyltransferase family 39 protein [Streptosporangiaceae bacterium]
MAELAPRPEAQARSASRPEAQTDSAQREQASGPAGRDGAWRYALPGWLVAAIPALVAFLITGVGLSGPSLWRDEAYTKDAISRSLSHLFALLGHTDAVHGAYYVMMHFVSEVIGTSDAALRFPSLFAMAVATGFTAAIGRRAAVLAGARWPGATGLLSGMLFAVAPYMTYYGQMARSYAFVTMFATIASYLLLRAAAPGGAPRGSASGGWRWWAGYGVAVAFTGLFNTFGLLIIPAHALTVLWASPSPTRGGMARWARRVAVPWLAGSLAAVAVLLPVLLISFRQRGQISWLAKPNINTITTMLREYAGSKALIVPVALLAVGGVMAALFDGQGTGGRRLSPAAIGLPWLVVPPVILLAVSLVKPVYSQRYIEFCLPALAILVAAGLVGLARLVATTSLGRRDVRVAWAPSAVIAAVLAVMLISPQHAIRQSSARPDDLRLASAIVAANEQPGDVVFYMPDDMYVLGTGYPAPFSRLRNIGIAESPVASATLTGREVTSPAGLAARFTDVKRVWFVTGNSNYKFPTPTSPVDKEMMALVSASGLHLTHRWQAGEVMLSLYSR